MTERETAYKCMNCNELLKKEQLVLWENTCPTGWRLACPICRNNALMALELYETFEVAKKEINRFHKQEYYKEGTK